MTAIRRINLSYSSELRIGFQKGASLFVLQKAQGSLEKRFAPLNVGVKWVEFPAGPQLLEGLNVGAVDVGYVGTFKDPITLATLKQTPKLEKMLVIQRGSRLSVQPVTSEEWDIVMGLGELVDLRKRGKHS